MTDIRSNFATAAASAQMVQNSADDDKKHYFCTETPTGLYLDDFGKYRWVRRYRAELLMFDLDGRGMGTAYTTKQARQKPLALGTHLGEAEFFLDDVDPDSRRLGELELAGETCCCTLEDCWFGQINGRNLKLCKHFATVIAWDMKVYRWELEAQDFDRIWTSYRVKAELPPANDDDESAACLAEYQAFISRLNDTGAAWAHFSRDGCRRRLWQHVHALKSREVELCANDVEPHPHDWHGTVRIKLLELWSDERRDWLDNYCSCTTFLLLEDGQTGEVLGRCCKHWLRMGESDAVASWALVSLSGDTVWESERVPPGPNCAER